MNKAQFNSLFVCLALALGAQACGKKKDDPQGNSTGAGTTNPGTTGPDAQQARSVAAFKEMGKVLTSPRCINCHPSGESPTQGDMLQPHQPPVFRGEKGLGEVGMRCDTCHGQQNYAFLEKQGSIPGVANWHLAPLSMAWQNKSLHEICMQLKDPARNGGKTVEQILQHHKVDPIVRWAWRPGAGRSTPPGTHEEFVKWTQEWVANGAHCPPAP